MKFGPILLAEASGCILAHSLWVGKHRLKKGHRLTTDDLALLAEEGIETIIAARLDSDDMPEDQAAEIVARAACGAGTKLTAAFTGRANLYAETRGIAVIDAHRVDRINLTDEALTIATVNPYETVEPRQMLATVKVIPFAAPKSIVQLCADIAQEGGPLVSVAPFQPHRVGLILTQLPETKSSVLEKTKTAVAERLITLGSHLDSTRIVAHETSAIAKATTELLADGLKPILIFGASAIVDRRDVIPAGIESAGGKIEHFGMPVDPGNLLLLGYAGNAPIIGVPGCARSPKLNGFDWVLQRILAGLRVNRTDIMRMGTGGLLKEILSRPQPREMENSKGPRAPRIAAMVLAAGQSRRMGRNKLLEPIHGQSMIQHAVDAILGSAARPVFVVIGHQADQIKAQLRGREVIFVDNPHYAEGLSTSLKSGLTALHEDFDGVLICLGDMPLIQETQLNQLIAAFNPVEGRSIIIPTWQGKRGNPVLFAAQFFSEIKNLTGDIGARHLLSEYQDQVQEVPMDNDSILVDIDTPERLATIMSKSI